MSKHLGLKFSIDFLEQYLFQNKIKISHIEMDHSTRSIQIFLDGAGPETPEGATVVRINEYELSKALQYIKECLTRD